MNILQKVKGALGIPHVAKSETSKVRKLVLPYCRGYGCDIGHGGDKIKKDAVGIDLPQPYTKVGWDSVDLPCDLKAGPLPVRDNTFNYVYSSHLIEDFPDTGKILREFVRVLKNNGHLILVFPDQIIYERYCKQSGKGINPHHVHHDMGFRRMSVVIAHLPVGFDYLYVNNCGIDYNVVIVIKIYK